jgi:triphosphoribosyl-dephospho-CoA synthetase
MLGNTWLLACRTMSKQATEEELNALRDRMTWRDDDLVFSRHGKNMTRASMREADSETIALVLNANDAVVLRNFEAIDGTLFEAAPLLLP